MKLSAEEKGYIAGLIDAEMSIQVRKRQHKTGKYVYNGYSVYLEMSNTDFDLIRWLLDRLGGSWGERPQTNLKWKPTFYWKLSGRKTVGLLKLVSPLLVTKQVRANLVVGFPFGKRSVNAKARKEEIYQEMRKLNLRGVQQQ